VTSVPRSQKISLIWLFWLICFSLCFAVLYYPETMKEGEKSNPEASRLDRETTADPSGRLSRSAGGFQVNAALPDATRQPSTFLGPQGLLPGPDIAAAVPTLNNQGRVVVEEQGSADLLAAFTVPAAPAPGQPAVLPNIIAPLKISPDAEAVKQKIAAKQQELCDDATFKATLNKFEAELKTKNFSQRANQMPDDGLGALIKKYARQHGVDARLVWAVIRNESGFNTQAVSPKGAMGLMQLIPSTAALMGVSDPFDAEQNISGGVRFLKVCLTKFNNNVIWALAAYNAGPDNVSKYQGCPPFTETRNYVLKVMRDYTGKTIALPLPVLAAGKGRPDQKDRRTGQATDLADAGKESGLDWKVPEARYKVAGPTWKLPMRAAIIVSRIPESIRQNPEVARLLAKQNARKLLP
jgi:hypothetical protein